MESRVSPTDDPLYGSTAKVKRASLHLDALHKEIRSVVHTEPKPYRFVTKVDVDSSRYLMYVRIDRELPIELSLIVGDFVQNLRAALDHMVWQFVVANDREPTKRNAFPIFDRMPEADRRDRGRRTWNAMVDGVLPTAVEFIEHAQPYQGVDGPNRHLLAALRDLSNEDKHRVILPSYGAIENPSKPLQFDVVGVRDVRPLKSGQLTIGVALKDKDLVLQAPVEITGPNPQVEAKGELPLDVGFGWPPVPLKGLRQMCHTVAEMVAFGRDLITGGAYTGIDHV